MTFKTLPRPTTKPASPPGKWRNVYWLAKPVKLRVSPNHEGGIYGPGRFTPRSIWPTREIAEAKGLASVERCKDRKHILYLGPEPV